MSSVIVEAPAPVAAPPVAARRTRSERSAVWAAGWLVAAGWAGSFLVISDQVTHRTWGATAAVAYLAAAGVAAFGRLRLSVILALVGAVALPLTWLVLTGQAQAEVRVMERSMALLLHTGSPYVARPAGLNDYNPYLPGQSLFGLPHALGVFGPLGDARLCCAAFLALCLAVGRRVLRGSPLGFGFGGDYGRSGISYGTAVGALVASPFLALPLCVSGVDIPLIGVCCLAPALALRGRPVAAGLVLAFACTLKWTAWPVVPVVLAALFALYGRRAALRCAAVTVAGAGAVVLPFALSAPKALVDQVFLFPTGHGAVATPAKSPLPGVLLAGLGAGGTALALGLLALSAVLLAVSLVRRPPRNAVACADRLALGLALAFALAPASRWGYFALPAVLLFWTRLASRLQD
ncbi:glycosyltransferase 87 family protein [Streptacidiphilus rugosus]|uniref:glycosyltransferase 87 family protein n=1 Tax=Streptacidiphilus rugosus TaxID=405783 RepID=UPI00068A0F44|nr:glycosyltransferase 87 family protein [Streptacidiphilus rugosus]